MKSLLILLALAVFASCSTETNSSYPNNYHFARSSDPEVQAAALFAASQMGITPAPSVINARSKRLHGGTAYQLILRNSQGRRWEATVHSQSEKGYSLRNSRIIASESWN